MKNKFRLFIINENSDFNKSITLTQPYIYIFGLLVSIIICLSFWGVFRLFNPHQNQQIINEAKNIQYKTKQLIGMLMEKNKIDSTDMHNFNLDNNIYNFSIYKPVDGIVTKSLSTVNNSDHTGIDIATDLNANIRASQGGLVVFSGIHGDYGKTIIIAHPNNYYTLYSHLNKIKVNTREYVKAKQIIGLVGESGKSSGPHLHFEIWKNHIIIDPRELIKEYKIKDVSIN